VRFGAALGELANSLDGARQCLYNHQAGFSSSD
jgi:hypothetical protein